MSRPHLSDRAFGLTFAVLLAAMALVPWLRSRTVSPRLPAASATMALVAFTAPWILLPLNRFWTAFTSRLGQVTNFLLLGVFFFMVVVPMKIMLHAFGRDPLCRVFEPQARTYWEPVVRQADAETLHDMF